jgi:predicted nuclease of predicted toxin-antitoxin system
VKLLLYQNLSPNLGLLLQDKFGPVVHVRDIGLQAADDRVICEHAARNGFIVVTKDADFNTRALLLGAPPKVVWIQRGNCSTRVVGELLNARYSDVVEFNADPDSTVLVLT